jgi:outer membrane lipoprotein carrier protein
MMSVDALRRGWLLALLLTALAAPSAAAADAVDTLRAFVRDVQSGSARFTQTSVAAEGARAKQSSGSFEFLRPNRFRFHYTRPFEQLIVADGLKVWIHDLELEQVSARRLGDALGATPAALLAGGSLEQDFTLSAEPAREGLDWALATPKARDGAFQAMRVGFRNGQLAAVEIVDSFGQRSTLRFADFQANAPLSAERFRFTPPPGVDLIEQ